MARKTSEETHALDVNVYCKKHRHLARYAAYVLSDNITQLEYCCLMQTIGAKEYPCSQCSHVAVIESIFNKAVRTRPPWRGRVWDLNVRRD
jgi:hypothetical protein